MTKTSAILELEITELIISAVKEVDNHADELYLSNFQKVCESLSKSKFVSDANYSLNDNVYEETKDCDSPELKSMKEIVTETLELVKKVKDACFHQLDLSLVKYYVEAREVKVKLIVDTLRILRMYRTAVRQVNWSEFLSEFFSAWLACYTKGVFPFYRHQNIFTKLAGMSQEQIGYQLDRHHKAWKEKVGYPFILPEGYNGWSADHIATLNKSLPYQITVLNQSLYKGLQRKRTEMQLLLTVVVSNDYAREIIDGKINFDCSDAHLDNPYSAFYRAMNGGSELRNHLDSLANDAQDFIKTYRDCSIDTLKSIVSRMASPTTPPHVPSSTKGPVTPPHVTRSTKRPVTPPHVPSSTKGPVTPPHVPSSTKGPVTPPHVPSSTNGPVTPPLHAVVTPPTSPPSAVEDDSLLRQSFFLAGGSSNEACLCRSKALRVSKSATWKLPNGRFIKANLQSAVSHVRFLRLDDHWILVPPAESAVGAESLWFYAKLLNQADRRLAHLEISMDGIRCIKAAAPFEPLKIVCNARDSDFITARQLFRDVCSLVKFLYDSCARQCEIASQEFLLAHPAVEQNKMMMSLILSVTETLTTSGCLEKHKFKGTQLSKTLQFITKSIVAFVGQDAGSLSLLTPTYSLDVGNRLEGVPFPWTCLLYSSVYRVFACHEDPRGVLQFLEDKWPQRANDMIAKDVFYKPSPEGMGFLRMLGSDGEYFGPIPADVVNSEHVDKICAVPEGEPSKRRRLAPPSTEFLGTYGSDEEECDEDDEEDEEDERDEDDEEDEGDEDVKEDERDEDDEEGEYEEEEDERDEENSLEEDWDSSSLYV
jgi:hypothetical protein